MRSVSKGGVETLAVNKISELAYEGNDFLKPCILTGEKGLSFDGAIEIYSDWSESAASYQGKVPVQVKGNTVSKYSPILSSHSVSKEDLRIYRQEEGVLFIKGELLESTRKVQLYYKSLLNLDLDELISRLEATGKNSITIHLKPFNSGKELRSICLKYLKDKEKQPSTLMKEITQIKFDGTEQIKADSIELLPQGDIRGLLHSQFYMYRIKDGVQFPMSIGRLESISSEDQLEIEFDGSNLVYSYTRTETVENTIITVEDAIVIKFKVIDNQIQTSSRINLDHNKVKSLSHYRKCLSFLYYYTQFTLQDKKLIDEFQFQFNDEAALTDIESLIEDLNEAEMLFHRIGISLDLELYPFQPKGLLTDFFIRLKELFIEEKLDEFNDHEFFVYNLRFHNHVIFAFLSKENDKKTLVTPSSPSFDKRIAVYFEGAEHRSSVSLFLLQDPDKLFKPINVTEENVFTAFNEETFDYNDMTFTATNNFVLGLIHTYDTDSNIKCLKLAEYICSNFAKYLNLNSKHIAVINHYQCLVRLNGILTEPQQDHLIEIRDSNHSDQIVQFCCYVLLESFPDARKVYNQLSVMARNELHTYPIYQLYLNGLR